jgi:hypothetical protein
MILQNTFIACCRNESAREWWAGQLGLCSQSIHIKVCMNSAVILVIVTYEVCIGRLVCKRVLVGWSMPVCAGGCARTSALRDLDVTARCRS